MLFYLYLYLSVYKYMIDTMKELDYESPCCTLLRVELHSCVLTVSGEDYKVNSYSLSWDEEEEEE